MIYRAQVIGANKDPGKFYFRGVGATEISMGMRDKYVIMGPLDMDKFGELASPFAISHEALDDFCANWLKHRGFIEDA